MSGEDPYNAARKRDVEEAAQRLREGNEGRERGFLKKVRVFPGFHEVIHHFFDGKDGFMAWVDGSSGKAPPIEIAALASEAVVAFQRLYGPMKGVRDAGDRMVFAENTWFLALLLDGVGKPDAALEWLRRTLEFEVEPEAMRETKLKMAEILERLGDPVQAGLTVAQVLAEDPRNELARALYARLNADMPLDP